MDAAERGTRLRAWIAALECTDSGRLMLTNVLFAFRTKRPSTDTIRDLLAAVIVRWSSDSGRRADSIVEVIADDVLVERLCSMPAARPAPCSRVVDALSLVSYNIKYLELGYTVSDEAPPSLLRRLETGIPEGAATGELRGRRPLAWVTRTEELAKLRDLHVDPDDLATAVRNRLGLSHYDQNELLVEVEYPPAILDAMHFVAPTFLEGGAGVIFRAQHSTDDWGRAVDLETLDDGLPEAVHRPVPFASDFRIRRIGRIKTDPGFSYRDVVTRAPHPWTEMPEDFKAFVEGLTAE